MTITLTEWLILSVIGALSLGGCVGHYFGYHNGFHDGRMHEQERQLEKRRAADMAKPYDGPPIQSKHAQVRPRTSPEREIRAHLARQSGKRVVTTADDIAPVIIPQPGTRVPMRPQPSPEPSHDTVTMRRLPADTGELRAIGAAWEEKTRREQAVWSHEYHQRCEADRQEAGLTPCTPA